MLSLDCAIVRDSETGEASKLFIRKKEAPASKRQVDTWSALPVFVFWQTFLVHVMNFHENVYKDAPLCEQCWHISLLQLCDRLRSRLYSMDMKTLLTFDTSAYGITVKRSTIHHCDTGLRLFASGTIGTVQMAWYKYAYLVFASLYKERHKTKKHGKAWERWLPKRFKSQRLC